MVVVQVFCDFLENDAAIASSVDCSTLSFTAGILSVGLGVGRNKSQIKCKSPFSVLLLSLQGGRGSVSDFDMV